MARLRDRPGRAGSLSSVRRPLVVGALAAAVALGVVAGIAVYERSQGHDVRGSPTIEFLTTDIPPQAPAPARRHLAAAWPTYGFDARRLRSAPGIQLRPPFRRIWTFHGRALLEFPPAVAYGRLYLPTFDGRFYALDPRTGKAVWRFDSRRCSWASPAGAGPVGC